MLRQAFHQPSFNNSQKRQKRQNCFRLKITKLRKTEKKYQMQSIDHLIDAAAKYISERGNKNGTFYFSKIDLKYAYSQIPFDTQLEKHCNFHIPGVKATGTYRFQNGFYWLQDEPATFQ